MAQKPLVIGVTGGSGSGKTTVSRELVARIPDNSAILLQQDAYYRDQSDKPFEERVKTNYDHPDSFETDLFVADLGVCWLEKLLTNLSMIMRNTHVPVM